MNKSFIRQWQHCDETTGKFLLWFFLREHFTQQSVWQLKVNERTSLPWVEIAAIVRCHWVSLTTVLQQQQPYLWIFESRVLKRCHYCLCMSSLERVGCKSQVGRVGGEKKGGAARLKPDTLIAGVVTCADLTLQYIPLISVHPPPHSSLGHLYKCCFWCNALSASNTCFN